MLSNHLKLFLIYNLSFLYNILMPPQILWDHFQNFEFIYINFHLTHIPLSNKHSPNQKNIHAIILYEGDFIKFPLNYLGNFFIIFHLYFNLQWISISLLIWLYIFSFKIKSFSIILIATSCFECYSIALNTIYVIFVIHLK